MTRHVLWTGGWDSSFRVLDLALVHGVEIQPHYIGDPNRPSTAREISAMESIRAALPVAAARRIGALRIVALENISANEVLSARYAALRQRGALGRQYEWLARYAAAEHLNGLELTVHVDDRAYDFLRSHVEERDGAYVLRDDTGDDALELFRPFSFPVLSTSKLAMERYAREHGFLSQMELTWFCHRPWWGEPCGTCAPCRFTIAEGLERRLPIRGRIRYRLRHVEDFGRGIVRRLRGKRLASADDDS